MAKGTHVVVYTVRGWIFTTEPMSYAYANLCLKDFQFANPDTQFAAEIKPVKG